MMDEFFRAYLPPDFLDWVAAHRSAGVGACLIFIGLAAFALVLIRLWRKGVTFGPAGPVRASRAAEEEPQIFRAR